MVIRMKEIMSKNLIIGHIENSIYEIASIMKEYDIGFVPIIKQNKIVGVVTDRDIVIDAVSNCANTNTKIENYMSHHIIAIESNKSIDDVLDLMASYKVKRVLVTEKNKVIGVVSLSNILSVSDNCDKILETVRQIYTPVERPNQDHLEIDEFYL